MRLAIFLILPLLALIGAVPVAAVAAVRALDQRRRDRDRVVLRLSFPRGLTTDQTAAVVRVVVGLNSAGGLLGGFDAVAFELRGAHTSISHYLHVPNVARVYLIAQLRAAIPGLAIEEDADKPGRMSSARELRRRTSTADLDVRDAAAASRAILAAGSELREREAVVWQLVIGPGITTRPSQSQSVWELLTQATPERPRTQRAQAGVVGVAIRVGAVAPKFGRARQLVGGMQRAAASVSVPGARLIPRLLPQAIVASRIQQAASPVHSFPALLRLEELVALVGWPLDTPLMPGLSLGGSLQLPAAASVPSVGRTLGRALVPDRAVAQSVQGAREHMVVLGPTGSGKTSLAVRTVLDDVAAGRGGLTIDPKGDGLNQAILDRLPEEAIGRTIVFDPTDEDCPVPLPLLASEGGAITELAADVLVGLLQHRFHDLGPRSTDILTSSLYALARLPHATILDLLRLWHDAPFRARVTKLVWGDPALRSFFAGFNGLSDAERAAITAAPANKIRPLVQRSVVRNVLAAPRSTFSFAEAMRRGWLILVTLPEGQLGPDATSLIGQVMLARVWSAVLGRPSGSALWPITIDEAPRFIDTPTDFADVLARGRSYGAGTTLIAQSLQQYPPALREMVLNSARSKVVFQTSAGDAQRLAKEFGPSVPVDELTMMPAYRAVGTVSVGGGVTPPFSFRTEELPPVIPGRADAVRQASRERFSIPRAELEAAISADDDGDEGEPIRVRRRPTS